MTTLIDMLVTVIVLVSLYSTLVVTVYGTETVLAGSVFVTYDVTVFHMVLQMVLAGTISVDPTVPALTPASKAM